MNRARTFLLLTVLAAAAVGIAFVSQQREDVIPGAGEPALPGLLERLNDVRRVTVVAEGETFDVELADGRWVVPGKDGYPADPDRVHLLLVGAAGLRRIEPKTSNPDLYPRIGLEDPSGAGATSQRYSIKDETGEPLADFVAGRRKPSKTTLEDNEIYVRIGDDPRSWLVHGRLPDSGTAVDWLDPIVVGVPEARIREVTIDHPDGERVVIRKASPGDADYVLVDKPAGREVDGQWKLDDIGRSFSAFEFEDVLAGALADVEGEPGLRSEMRTHDGLVVTLDTRVAEDRTYGAFGARFEASAAGALDALRESAGEAGAALLDAAEVEAEAERLAARWERWVYELPPYRVNYLGKRLEEILAAPAADGATSTPAADGLPPLSMPVTPPPAAPGS